jgi:hypothetical protein
VQYAGALFARWTALPKRARTLLAATCATGLAVLVAAGVLSHPSRSALFAASLHPERLASWNVAFTPAADNLIVDTSRRNDLLLRLSLSGVPHPHLETTSEALAGVGLLTPQDVVDAQTRAGLAGDIEAGLRGIDGIDDAQVIVVPSKPASFADESSKEASASVRLHTRAGIAPSRQTIAGIRAFVAASVAGLQPDHVTILDDRGIALNETESGGDAGELQRALQSALDAAFGGGCSSRTVRCSTTPRSSYAAMPDGFVHLADYVRPCRPPAAPEGETESAPANAAPEIADDPYDGDLEQAVGDVRRFRATLADALDVALERLLLEIACDVLARELRLGPAEVASVVARARERAAADEPHAVRVHPDDAAALAACGCRIVADDRLRRGDVRLEVSSGSIDLTLGARLERVLEACAG